MNIRQLTTLVAVTVMTLTACDDTTDSIGSSLTPNVDRLNVQADTFNITSRTITAESVAARNTTGYLGRVKDPETGDVITANFMTQFHTLTGFYLPDDTSMVSRDNNGEIVADSCEIELTLNGFYGDSLAQMKTRTYAMSEPMDERVSYTTDYDPLADGKVNTGYYRDRTYTVADLNVSDSLRSTSTYIKNIRIKLDKPFTKDGVTYNNYGTYILRSYYKNPEKFRNNYDFVHDIVPGFYFKTTGGVGNMAYINTPLLVFYFKYNVTSDSTVAASSSFAGTEEVLQSTTFTNDNDRLAALAADNSCTYLKSPAGLYTELTLPVTEIMSGHENDTINTARVNIPRLVNQVATQYPIDIPQSVLMIPLDSVHSFFANGQLPDYVTSYISTYSSSSNSYVFGNISGLVNAMYRSRMNGNTSANWNKAVLVPVTLETTTSSSGSSTLVNLSNNMSLTSTRLLGGSDNPDALKITVIYSKFNATH